MRPSQCIAIPCLLLALTSRAGAESCRTQRDALGPLVPDYVKLQTGGYLGMLTVGTGYTPVWPLDIGAYYGWVPAAVGGKDIHEIALRVGGRTGGPCLSGDLAWDVLEGGLGMLFTFGEGFFQRVPDRYVDRDYYRVTGRRLFLTLGSELTKKEAEPWLGLVRSHGLFVETTVLDQYAHVWFKNPHTVSFWDIFSTSVGYGARF